MVAKKIPGGKVCRVHVRRRVRRRQVVPAAWMKINSLPKTAVGGDRVYRADFEVYDERAMDPQNLQVDVYVGIR